MYDPTNVTSVQEGLGIVTCPPPQIRVCPPPPVNSGIKIPPCFCLQPPPPVQHFQVVPDFYIMNVVYAPPGKSSNISYSNSSSVGTTTSSTSGFKTDVKVTAEASGGILGRGTVTVSGGTSWGNSHSDAVDIVENWSQGFKKSGQVDRIDHNYDEIWFLIRPLIDVTFQPPSSSQQATTSWKFAATDGQNNDIVQFVYAGWLNNAMQMPADVRSLLDFYGITPDKYSSLLSADPLFTGVSPNQTMDSARFDYLGAFPFVPPFSQGDQASTQSFSLDRKVTNTATATSDHSYSVGVSTSAGFDVSIFKAKLTVAGTWTWTSSSSNKQSTGNGATDAFTVGQPAFGYTGPTILRVYEDRIYKTYAFTLDWPQGETNLALGQSAWQSTDLNGSVASRADDGNTDGNWWDGSVTHTDYGFVNSTEADWPGQYWAVDLGSERVVNAINIFNRTDCCSERLSHYNLLAYDSNQGQWKVISNHSADDTTGVSFFHWPVNMVRTQYVMVAKTDENYLQLAEVQVMGF